MTNWRRQSRDVTRGMREVYASNWGRASCGAPGADDSAQIV